jgi:hypothetical protein
VLRNVLKGLALLMGIGLLGAVVAAAQPRPKRVGAGDAGASAGAKGPTYFSATK